jgi:hypothetical protein
MVVVVNMVVLSSGCKKSWSVDPERDALPAGSCITPKRSAMETKSGRRLVLGQQFTNASASCALAGWKDNQERNTSVSVYMTCTSWCKEMSY